MNLQQQEQFFQFMNRVKGNSRAASLSISDARVSEIVNGLIVSKPKEKEPVVIDLQAYTKSGKAAAYVPGINKLKVIQDFINHKH